MTLARPTRGPTAPVKKYAPPTLAARDDHDDGALLARAAAILAQPPPQIAKRPPPDPGEVLASIDRGDGVDLRVTILRSSGKGAPYISVGEWKGGWPVPGRSVSVRLREIGAVLGAFVDAAERRAALATRLP
jgi:hypothetical protein